MHATIPRTLTTLERSLASRAGSGAVQAWLFESATARRAAERRLAQAGVHALLRSSFKPLLHAFIEEIELADVVAAEIGYPVVAGAPRERFRVECYPVDALLGERAVSFRALGETRLSTAADAAAPAYEVRLRTARNEVRELRVPVPVRWAEGADGAPVLRACGWHDGWMRCDLEIAFDTTMSMIDRLPLSPGGGPFFERLRIALTGPFGTGATGLHGERIDFAEMMHEELCFGALERFARLTGLPPGAAALRPGQIVPAMRTRADGDWTLSVAPERAAPASASRSPRNAELADADEALSQECIDAHLETLGGTGFVARSRQGRAVHARHVPGDRRTVPAVVLSAGQHANEPTGSVGVLRAARELATQGHELAVVPMLNPDGHALYAECLHEHPEHMHHAARFDGYGNDVLRVVPGTVPDGGLAALLEARKRTGAELHVSCHGYPAHEWARPLSGYLSRGFERWTLPKGFFLIVRHAPDVAAAAERIVDACVEALVAYADVMAINDEQLARYRRYLPDDAFEVRRGVPVFVSPSSTERFPLNLVTEAPDETVRGTRFRILAEAQRRVVLAAVRAHCRPAAA